MKHIYFKNSIDILSYNKKNNKTKLGRMPFYLFYNQQKYTIREKTVYYKLTRSIFVIIVDWF